MTNDAGLSSYLSGGRRLGAAIALFTGLGLGHCAAADGLPSADSHGVLDATATTDEMSRRNTLVIGAGAGIIGLYGAFAWWNKGFSGTFRSINEDWLGEGTIHGGADKLGHAWSTYASARAMSLGFSLAGNTSSTSARLGVLSALGLMLGVEVLDGLSRQYRFSPQDAVMDVAGAGIAWALETHPALDSLFAFRFHYWPSTGHSFDPGADYGGQTYLLSLKASGIDAMNAHAATRYLELALGYGARGYETPRSADPHRNLYVGLSLNVGELLSGTVFRDTSRDDAMRRTAETFFKVVQLPGTVVLKGNRL